MLDFYIPKRHNKEFITVNNTKYYLVHRGINGNVSYQILLKVSNRLLYLELVNDGGKWSFHVEHKENLIFDSKIGKVFYKTPEEAHSEMINSIFLKYLQSNGSTTL